MQALEAELRDLQAALQQYADSDPEKHDATGTSASLPAIACILYPQQ